MARVCSNCGHPMEGSVNPKCPATGSNHKFAAVEYAEAHEEVKPSKRNKAPQ